MVKQMMTLIDDLQLTKQLLIKTSCLYDHNFPTEETSKTARSAARYTDNTFVPYYLCKYINNRKYRVENVQMAS